jgi:hypothetical protein
LPLTDYEDTVKSGRRYLPQVARHRETCRENQGWERDLYSKA